MKKWLSLLVALAMVLSLAPMAFAENAAEEAAALPEMDAATRAKTLVVGDISELSGANLFTAAWGNNAAEARIRELIYGYETVVFTRNAQFEINPTVVKEHEIVVNDDGSKTYTMTINEGLTYNEGTPISAKDYVFTALLLASPQFAELGADLSNFMETVGYDEYSTGEATVFAGIHLLDDYTFSITIKAEELPYFYDIAYASVTPYPIHVIAPGCDVADDGEGAYITGEFTADLMQTTVMDETGGYRYFPTVTSGPYQFVEFDRSTKMMTVELNPNYAGNYAGIMPSIERIIWRLVKSETMVEDLRTGGVDIIQALSGALGIPPAYDMMEEEAEKAGRDVFDYITYPRAGYGKIAFHCDIGPTQFAEVRQAIAYCLDRPEFARQYSAGYAIVVNSRYGVAQWMYAENADEVEEAMNPYSFSLENAKQALIDGGWTLNEKGEEFVEGTDEIRYKDVDGELMACIIKWADTDNEVAKLIRQMLPENMAAVGMKLEPTVMDFPVMLEEYYGSVENRQYTMFNLGAGFSLQDSPWFYYDPDPKWFGNYNSNFIADDVLYETTQAMKSSDNNEDYYENWFGFVVRFNELLPDIPLYSDDYHDVFTARLQNFEHDALYPVTYALAEAELLEELPAE